MIRLKNPITYIVLAIAVMSMASSCSSHKHNVKKRAVYEEQIKQKKEIENETVSELKGHEKKIIEEAFEWIGTKYEFGAKEKGKSTDCSGMITVIYEEQIGCKLPRNSAKQAEFCDEIDENEIRPGDLVFFITNSGNKINHVGIMIDALQFIHAATKGVTVSSLESAYYRKNLKQFGRVPCMNH